MLLTTIKGLMKEWIFRLKQLTKLSPKLIRKLSNATSNGEGEEGIWTPERYWPPLTP